MTVPSWPRRRRTGLAIAAIVGLVATLGLSHVAYASVNLLVNPGLEALDGGGFPNCWETSGWGDSTFAFTVTDQAHTGSRAMSLAISAISSGDRKMMMAENPSCAPTVAPGHQYDLSQWYTSTTPDAVVTVFRHDVAAGWQYWTDLSNLATTPTWQLSTVRTPVVPPDTDQITWGVTVYGTGTLVSDDYSMVDVTQPVTGDDCSAGPACTRGAWQVLPFTAPVRSIHAVVLKNGNVLMVAGSGNDPDAFAAGTFTSAVYQTRTGTFVSVPTPSDMFCAGHVQLADGRVLILGGNKAYPDSSHGYEGLADSYVFDPDTDTYSRLNDLSSGHWYPSATELGNGDVIALGGLGADSAGTVATEYFDAAAMNWLSLNQAHQTWSFWGLYPTMVLMQDGRLFYTGAHVFGNGLPGSGSSIYDYNANTITDVPGLRNKDQRDEGMSVLLPPAQNQTVLTIGGGNNQSNVDANRTTDIIDLKAASPTYLPGPDLPGGTLTGGTPETAGQGKMYVSAVILPDGNVFETGGGLHDRADPVFEASMYSPTANAFTPGLATDPVPRTYHSSAFLLPDGRVMAVGNNPGDGSFDQRVSVYSPPYLFDGARPQINWLATQSWGYGSSQAIAVDAPVVRASLIRPAAVTHSSDPNQRYVELPMTVNGNDIALHVTNNPNIAPPGWYMLFVVNAAGVPSVAQWVHLG
jgi:Domain of unknown function (DUF1929)